MVAAIKNPKVSICIPTFNYGQFIFDAIQSVLEQTFSDFELIIVDNCSTDNTKDLVEMFLKKDERIFLVCNDTNIGMAGNWNRCLQYARGEYIKILCADDVIKTTCIEKQVNILDEFSNVVLVSCGRLLVDENLQQYSNICYSNKFETINGFELIAKCLMLGNVIGEPTAVMFRKSLSFRGFNDAYNQLIDLEMWYHILEQGDFFYINENLCLFRQHSDQTTKYNVNQLLILDDELLIKKEYLDKWYVKIPYRKKLYINLNITYLLWSQLINNRFNMLRKLIGFIFLCKMRIS